MSPSQAYAAESGPAHLRLPPALAQEIVDLHPQQRQAVRHQGNLVLVAGPGAGKTRTLVARVGQLLATTSPHRGVAAITYTDTAAAEVTTRLRALGIRPGRRLASRTVHAFCLHHILRPYARFTDIPYADNLTILDEAQSNQLWAEAAFAVGLPVRDKPDALLTKIRRLMASGEGTEGYQHQFVSAVRHYEQALIDSDCWDFDAMPGRALAVLRTSQPARDMLSARFPHLVVDEYQDLNPVLHAVVVELLASGVQVTAVGDPDQTMYAFQGADIRYLKELHERDDFTTVQLTVNFRSGSTLVAAGRGVLGVDRGYRADPNQEAPGTVTLEEVSGDLDDHAQRTVDVVHQRIAAGIPPEDIAVLYPGNKNLLARLINALQAADLPCDMERTRKIPGGPLADFVSACTARRLAGPVPGGGGPAPERQDLDEDAPRLPQEPLQRRSSSAQPARTIRDLATTWHRHRQAAGITLEDETPRALARQLLEVLDAPERETPEDDAGDFLNRLLSHLDIDQVAQLSPDLRIQQAPSTLQATVQQGLTMAELAGDRAPGRIVLTTYHSAKGREFSVVILPGLVDGLMPFYFATRGLSNGDLKEQRHNFYVAVTRAQDEVVLITGDHFTDPYHGVRTRGRSRFVDDIVNQMSDPG
ncbi:ATP-dependent helicase [Streptomyces sp. TRM68367]|uniref:ATP-dependent helicase n=1 Tax=Streptomyces sp. TRM68367 TaxID=2758415 RepID=UPI00165A384E|nr:ATP-dependent helicase [Streptomyces sp. TRM68367]MBC9728237.1 ATP-dependent helicase [Streptomyces sp. TRM68367]